MVPFPMDSKRLYLSHPFRVKWGGRIVAGFSKMSIQERAGHDAITLERGVTNDVEFVHWASQTRNAGSEFGAKGSLQDPRRDVLLEVYDEAGQLSTAYKVHPCRVAELEAHPDLGAGAVVIARIRLEYEGGERALAVTEPQRMVIAPTAVLGQAAERVEHRVGWDRLHLPQEQLDTLRLVARHLRAQPAEHERSGLGMFQPGLAALFTGPSRTAKMLAAEVLAAELGLDLHRIDLSTVVSKIVGETKKNLERVFKAAEASRAILLFDDADALFGQRSEVKDTHDRYANLEVSYLLQRMETYQGLVVLATNLEHAIDPGLIRRCRFAVYFPPPDPD